MSDDKISRLLQELRITNPEWYELVHPVRQAIYCVVPDASERVMYGGWNCKKKIDYLRSQSL